MQRVDLIAIKPFSYGGRELKAGDAFHASVDDADILKGVGQAEDAPRTEQAQDEPKLGFEGQGIGYDESATGHEAQGRQSASRARRYKRRDMTAEPDAS